MTQEERSRSGSGLGGFLAWFFGGITLSVTIICSVVLLGLLIISTLINLFLSWEMSGVELVVNLPTVETPVTSTATPLPTSVIIEVQPTVAEVPTEVPTEPAASTSNNQYELIPLNGSRDSRPAEEHGDLNLNLRTPQRIQTGKGLNLLDLAGGSDPNAPQLSQVLPPDFIAEYSAKNWDWDCNCPSDWIQGTALMGIKTHPGDPIRIPPTPHDIFGGVYHAVLLYASEDTITFSYTRDGTIANGYSIHYKGLQTDPNLLALYRSSTGNELPGLDLDTPVGVATDELIVAVRDKGTFMDVRSRKDWWR